MAISDAVGNPVFAQKGFRPKKKRQGLIGETRERRTPSSPECPPNINDDGESAAAFLPLIRLIGRRAAVGVHHTAHHIIMCLADHRSNTRLVVTVRRLIVLMRHARRGFTAVFTRLRAARFRLGMAGLPRCDLRSTVLVACRVLAGGASFMLLMFSVAGMGLHCCLQGESLITLKTCGAHHHKLAGRRKVSAGQACTSDDSDLARRATREPFFQLAATCRKVQRPFSITPPCHSAEAAR